MEVTPEKEGKTNAIIGYITMLGTIVAIILNMDKQNPFARFHIRQAFGINITYLLLGTVAGYFNSWSISYAFYIFITILWFYGFITMLQEKSIPIPFIGPYFQKWFTFIK